MLDMLQEEHADRHRGDEEPAEGHREHDIRPRRQD